MNRICTAAVTATASVAILLGITGPSQAAGVAHPGQAIRRFDPMRGVVTHHEFTRAQLGERRRDVECLYGVRGVRVYHWGHYTVVDYPTASGVTTDVVYRIRRDGARVLDSRHWYYSLPWTGSPTS